jgi:hypothetical protein
LKDDPTTPSSAPEPAIGAAARALQGLIVGRFMWWFSWPFVLLGAAGLAVSWTNLSTLIRYERLKAAATAETHARVGEMYWEVVPSESLGPLIGGRTGPASRLSFRLSYSSADGRPWSLSFRGDPDIWAPLPLTGFGFLEVPEIRFRFPRPYLEKLKRTQAEEWPWAYDPKAPAGSKTAWHSEYDLFWRRLDQPFIRQAFLWRHAETPEGMPVRYDPADPSRALPVALMRSEMPPALRWGISAFVVGFLTLWGMGFLAGGLAFLAHGVSGRARMGIFLAVVASTPLWAPYLVRVARLVGGQESFLADILLREFTIQKFLGFRLPEPLPEPGDVETVRYDWVRSKHTAALASVAPDRGGRNFETDDAAYGALADQLTARTVALGDADLLTLFAELGNEEHEGAELAEPFLDALRTVSLDRGRYPAVPKFARRVLAETLVGMQFDPNAFARGERLRRVRDLVAYRDPDVSQRAAAYVADAAAYKRRGGRVD